MALIVFAGTLSVTHHHQHESASHPDCGLCITAHMAVQAASPAPTVLTTPVFTEVESSDPIARPRTVTLFALFSRPPPADSNRS
jgi:hypothetical protein